MARPALEAARRNFALNRLPPGPHRFHAEDAFEFLEGASAAGNRWDIVISDPPSFAPRKNALPVALRAYRRLHTLAAAVVAEGGLFCPASCSSHLDREAFLATVEEGARAANRRFRLESLRGAGRDHPVASWFPEGDYLKFAIGRLEGRGERPRSKRADRAQWGTMSETGSSFGGRKRFEGPGGTPGGMGEFLLGIVLSAIGIYLLFDRVTVHTSFWRLRRAAEQLRSHTDPAAAGHWAFCSSTASR